jgi:hypothetical protein
MDQLERCFENFHTSAFRLETLRGYIVPAEADRLAAFLGSAELPEPSSAARVWLKRIASTTAAGKTWQRVRVVSEPLSDYERFELAAYAESAAAGEQILIAKGISWVSRINKDFWLFDDRTAAVMEYGVDGRYIGSWVTDDLPIVTFCCEERDAALAASQPLATWLAEREG